MNDIQVLISQHDSQDISDNNYVDIETGEVYLEPGDYFGHSDLHPSYVFSWERTPKSLESALAEIDRDWKGVHPEDVDMEDCAYDLARNFIACQDERDVFDWEIDLESNGVEDGESALITLFADTIYGDGS